MPRPKMLPAEDPEQTQEFPVRTGPRPWTGKIHDPGKLFMQELEERKAARNTEFQAGQVKNVLGRIGELETNQEKTAQTLEKILNLLQPKSE